MKRTLAIILAVVMTLSTLIAIPFTANAAEGDGKIAPDYSWYGDGTKKDYYISNAAELLGLAYITAHPEEITKLNSNIKWATDVMKDKNFYLTADIDLNPGVDVQTEKSAPNVWTGIQGMCNTAVFDGQGHTVSGAFNGTAGRNFGFFAGEVNGNSQIKNLIITDSYFKTSSTTKGDNSNGNVVLGGLVGYWRTKNNNEKLLIDNVYVDIDLEMPSLTNYTYTNTSETTGWVGGIYGESYNASKTDSTKTVSNAVYAGTITQAESKWAGGVYGKGDSEIPVNISNYLYLGSGDKVGDSPLCVKGSGSASNVNVSSVPKAADAKTTDEAKFFETYPDLKGKWSLVTFNGQTAVMPNSVASMVKDSIFVQQLEVGAEEGTVDLRFFSGVDSLEWQEVGFKVEVEVNGTKGDNVLTRSSKTVYTSIIIDGQKTAASDRGFGYFYTGYVGDIPAADTDTVKITVRTYKKAGDGTVFEGLDSATVTLMGGVMQ